MNRLWAPWRQAYIQPEKGKRDAGCLFCRIAASSQDTRNLVLRRTSFSFALLNLYPYNSGHLMVLPLRHVSRPSQLSREEKLDGMDLMDEMIQVLEKVLRPQGFNTGLNLGNASGAGIPGHLHYHLVPRWNGDANFMTTTGETRVIPESLQGIYKRLKAALKPKKS